jgi:PhoPQ-activated pathogenicity-related protein
MQSTGKALPKVAWKHDIDSNKLRVTIEASPAPSAARLWIAAAPTRDFRKSTWIEKPAAITKNTITGEVAPPAEGCLAFYADLDYEIDGIPYHLCTQIRVAGNPK